MPNRRRATLAAALLTLLCACAGEPAGPPFQSYDFAFEDPVADTLPNTDGVTAPALDVIGVSGTVSATELVLTLSFTTQIAPWSAAQPNSLDGFLDLDLDQNSATGVPGAAEEYGGSAPLGAEYYLSLRQVGVGMIALVNSETRTYRAVPATVSGTTMRIVIPRGYLADEDGQFRLSLVVGTPGRPATDFAPSTGYYTAARP
jgi:hypothetical protein